ncbi:hypothetical protein BDZ89DRAFT_1138651 [Hymenopellis radicata]|nr:hypothetical protein BDZ89DRAFT_1138651 [Hymenopellis radicata]
MDQRPPRELRLRQGISQSRRWRRYEPYARAGPLFARETLPIVVDDDTSVEQLAMSEETDEAFDTGVELVQEEMGLMHRLTWWKLVWATVGAAIVLRVVGHVGGLWATE